jgi:hypothetical protein
MLFSLAPNLAGLQDIPYPPSWREMTATTDR